MTKRGAWILVGGLGFGSLACSGESDEPAPSPTGGAASSGGAASGGTSSASGGAASGGTSGSASGGAASGGATTDGTGGSATGGAPSGGSPPDGTGGSSPPTTQCDPASSPQTCTVVYEADGMRHEFVGIQYCNDGVWSACMDADAPPP